MHERVYRALLRANEIWRKVWGIKMEKRDFRYCCGTSELGDFGWNPNLIEFRGLVKKARMDNKGYVTCTTVNTQARAVEMLKAEKFHVLAEFHNPNSGNRVTLWGRETL